MRYSLLILGCLALPLWPARAQGQGPDLTPGSRIRITARAAGLERARGTLSAISGDAVVVAVRQVTMERGLTVAHDTVLRVPVEQVERLEVRHRAPFNRTGAAIGGAVGGVLTAPGGPAGLLFGIPFGIVIGGGGKRAFKTGAIGAAVGTMSLGVLMAATFDESDIEFQGPRTRADAFAWGAIGGGMLGFMVGGVIGTFTRGDWEPVSLGGDRKVALTPAVGPSGVGIAVSVRF
jgi:hypothetical protein